MFKYLLAKNEDIPAGSSAVYFGFSSIVWFVIGSFLLQSGQVTTADRRDAAPDSLTRIGCHVPGPLPLGISMLNDGSAPGDQAWRSNERGA